MKNENMLQSLRPAMAAALLLGAGSLFANPEYVYSGRDATYSQIITNLTITQVSTGYDVTGNIRVGNCLVYVAGTFAGTTVTAEATFSLPYSVTAVTNITGRLTGALGVGSIDLATGPIYLCNSYYYVSSMMYPVKPPTTTKTAPPPVALPASVHMTGSTGFGYTVVTLTLNTTLKGSSYEVTGTMEVRQEVTSPKVEYYTTTMTVSGVLTPGVQGVLTISGAPANNTPHYSGTIAADGTSFSSLLTGLPTLGITGLYIDAVE